MLPDDEFEREHESYGILRISRTSGGGSIRLFGSPLVTHYGSIRLSISKGKWIHGLNHDRFFGMSKDHIEIEMSAAQFITTSAKAEVEAFVSHAVRAAGLQAIAEGRLPSLLPSPKAVDPRCGSQGVDDDGHCLRCGLMPVEDEGSNCPEGFLK